MAKYRINVDYPRQRMVENKRRQEAAMSFQQTDRAPVLFGSFERYYLDARGVGYDEFFADPRSMLHQSILNQKWAIENMPDDRCVEPVIEVYPWWENVVNPSAFGAEIRWYDDQPPWSAPVLSAPDDVFRLEVPPPEAGLWGRRIEYFRAWQELIGEYDVTFNGEPGRVVIRPLEAGGEGPFLTAVNLAGQDFYLWLREWPEVCHVLLDKVTTALLNANLHFREVDPRPRAAFFLAEDFAEQISANMFRQFCIPYDHRLFAFLGRGLQSGRGFHMCGDTTHLLDVLAREARVTDFWGYGAMVDARLVAEKMGGSVRVTGGIPPTLLLTGPREEIRDVALYCLCAFAPYGGFTLADGCNVAPGTPLEHLATVVQAAIDFGPLPRPGVASREVSVGT